MSDARYSVAKENLSPAKGRNGHSAVMFPAMLAGNAALALGPLFVRMADVGPVAAGFWRLTLALPLLLLFAWKQGWSHSAVIVPDHSDRRASPGSWVTLRPMLGLAAIGGLFFATDLASWHIGIHQTKMANATLFGNAASLILAATTLVMARRWPRWFEATAIFCAVAGAVLLMRESSGEGQARLTGDLLCLLAGLLYAGYVLSMQRVRASLPSWTTLALSSATGIGPLLLIALAMGEQIMPGSWGPVLLLALLSQVIGQGLLIYSLPHFSALVVGLTLLSQPAIAALIGWLAYGEVLSVTDVVGMLLIGFALVLIRLPIPSSRRG